MDKKAISFDAMLVGAKPIAVVFFVVASLFCALMPTPENKEMAELWKLCTGQGNAVMMGLSAFLIMMVPGGWPSWRQSAATFGAAFVAVVFITVGALVGGLATLVGLALAIFISPTVYLAFCRVTGHRHLVDVLQDRQVTGA